MNMLFKLRVIIFKEILFLSFSFLVYGDGDGAVWGTKSKEKMPWFKFNSIQSCVLVSS